MKTQIHSFFETYVGDREDDIGDTFCILYQSFTRYLLKFRVKMALNLKGPYMFMTK